jgi:uncharacterized protein YuzE
MKLAYDRDKNIAYLRLRPKGSEVDTIRISDEMNIDIAPDGSVYGIELLNANEQLRSADGGKLVLVDEVENRKVEMLKAGRVAATRRAPAAVSRPPSSRKCNAIGSQSYPFRPHESAVFYEGSCDVGQVFQRLDHWPRFLQDRPKNPAPRRFHQRIRVQA